MFLPLRSRTVADSKLIFGIVFLLFFSSVFDRFVSTNKMFEKKWCTLVAASLTQTGKTCQSVCLASNAADARGRRHSFDVLSHDRTRRRITIPLAMEISSLRPLLFVDYQPLGLEEIPAEPVQARTWGEQVWRGSACFARVTVKC